MNIQRKSVTELFGLPEAPKNGRERLLTVAIDLFYRRGFNAVGIDQVIAAAGVTKTTFYKHFESKDDLMVSAVKLRDTWETAAWGRAVHQLAGDDPRKQLLLRHPRPRRQRRIKIGKHRQIGVGRMECRPRRWVARRCCSRCRSRARRTHRPSRASAGPRNRRHLPHREAARSRR